MSGTTRVFELTFPTADTSLGLVVDEGRVTSIDPGSIAEKAGITQGVLITEINNVPTKPIEIYKRVGELKKQGSYPLHLRLTVADGGDRDSLMIVPPTPSPMSEKYQTAVAQQPAQTAAPPTATTTNQPVPAKPVTVNNNNNMPTVTLLPKMPFFEPTHNPDAASLLQQALAHYPTADSCPWEAEFPADPSFCENLRLQHLLTPEANTIPHYEIQAPADDSAKIWNINKIWFSGFKEAWFTAHPHEVTIKGPVSSHLVRASNGFWTAACEAFSGYQSNEMSITSSQDKRELKPSLQQWNDMVSKWNVENHCTEQDRRKHVENRIAEANLIRKYQDAEQRAAVQEEMVRALLAKNKKQKERHSKRSSCTNCKKLEQEVSHLSKAIHDSGTEANRLRSWEQRLANKEEDLLSQELMNAPVPIVGDCPLPPAASRYRMMNSQGPQHQGGRDTDTPILAPHPVHGSRPVYSPSRRPQVTVADQLNPHISWHVTVERDSPKESLRDTDSRRGHHSRPSRSVNPTYFNFQECYDEI